jgi:hypothetical protein
MPASVPTLKAAPVLVYVGGIDHEVIFILCVAIDEQVIYDTAYIIGQAGVLYLAIGEFGGVIGSDELYQFERPWPAQHKLAHVRHIKHAYTIAHLIVLGIDTGIRNRHIISCELCHPGAERLMNVCEGGIFHFLILRRQM